MSTSINIQAYASNTSPEFIRHFKAVQFCLDHKLSFPKETSEFFNGKIGGGSLEDYNPNSLIKYVENGVEVDMPVAKFYNGNEYRIKVSDIPKEVDIIIVSMS